LYQAKAKTEHFLRNILHTQDQSYGMNFSIQQASSHNAFKTKVKSLILNDDIL